MRYLVLTLHTRRGERWIVADTWRVPVAIVVSSCSEVSALEALIRLTVGGAW